MPLKKTPAAIFPSFSLTFFFVCPATRFQSLRTVAPLLGVSLLLLWRFWLIQLPGEMVRCSMSTKSHPCPCTNIHDAPPSNRKWQGSFHFDWGTKMPIGALTWPYNLLFSSPTFCIPPFFWEGNLAGSATKVNITGFLLKKTWFDTYQGNDKKGLHTMKKPVAMVFETSNTKPWIATWINILDAYSIINTCQILKKTIQKTSDIPPHFDIHCIILRISSTLRPPWLQRFGVAFWPPPRGVALQWPNARPESDWDVTGWDVYLSLHGTIP